MWARVICLLVAGSAAYAETDILALTDGERIAFRAEIRALFLDEPELIARALAPPSPAAEETQAFIDDDLSLLDDLAPQILDGADVALFIQDNCDECTLAIEELELISDRYGATFILHNLADKQTMDLSRKLGMDITPFYVLPNMILRGHMPAVVLEKYLRGK